mmetsp:Transcript_14678/g.36577  ORF Transcript_14678/g.36577 Transcript_14678/m.36577 type:complete len:105 (-) Transcript_14678:348-662(-)
MSEPDTQTDQLLAAAEQGLAAAHHESELQKILAVQRASLQDLRTMRTALSQRNTHMERLALQLQAALAAQSGDLPRARQDMDAVHRQLRSMMLQGHAGGGKSLS